MTTSVFPASLDTFVDPAATSKCNGSNPTGPVATHAALHTLENDAIAALQAKVGIDSSADHNSLDYKIASALAGILALQGTSLLYGSGSPSSGTGVDGNFYLDETAHVIYGPKTSGAWPAGVTLVGADGSPGSPGPANSLSIGTVTTGAAGSSASATITGTAPSQTLNLTIPRGDAGADGAPGTDGTDGAPGVVQSVVAGTNITVDNTDPANPVVNASGGGGSSPLTTKGDLYGYDTADARIHVGLNGQALIADSGKTLGVGYGMPFGSQAALNAVVADIGSVALWYKCDETSGTTIADSSGNGKDLTLQGTNTLNASELIDGGGALLSTYSATSANGAARADAAGLTVPMNYDWTYCAVVMAIGSTDNVSSVVFMLSSTGESEATNAQIVLYINVTNGIAMSRFLWEYGAGSNEDHTVSGVPYGQPFMLAMRKDSTAKTVSSFVNGRKSYEAAYTNEPTGGSSVSTYLNTNNSGTSNTIMTSNTMFWTSALTDAQIKALSRAAGFA